MRPTTPRGFRDVLFQEAAERRAIGDALSTVMGRWGYRDVETPLVEEYRTLESAAGGSLEGTAMRLFDADGGLLALRPEMTLPIARLAATRLAQEPLPLRVSYRADVVREHASLRGEARQFTQVGVELIGTNGAVSDAEVVCVLADALESVGLTDVVLGIGTVAVLRALLDAAGGDAAWRAAVLDAAHRGDIVGLDRLAGAGGIDAAAAAALRAVPRIGGGAEAIERCREAVTPAGCASALGPLAETWALLESTGVADRVRVDFSIMRSFDYYTGMIVEAYAPGLGVPLGGGGRYDEVLGAFGTPMPAAGFALSIERLHIAAQAQGVQLATPALDAVIGGEDAAAVLRAGARLRARGLIVRLAPGADAAMVVADARRDSAALGALAVGDTLVDAASGRQVAEEEL